MVTIRMSDFLSVLLTIQSLLMVVIPRKILLQTAADLFPQPRFRIATMSMSLSGMPSQQMTACGRPERERSIRTLRPTGPTQVRKPLSKRRKPNLLIGIVFIERPQHAGPPHAVALLGPRYHRPGRRACSPVMKSCRRMGHASVRFISNLSQGERATSAPTSESGIDQQMVVAGV
jgi:hypothetical protein